MPRVLYLSLCVLAQVHALEREIDVLKDLCHPNIIQYLGTSKTSSRLLIFYEYASGGSLARMIGRFGPLSESIIRRFSSHILLGLQYLHDRGIMHRDIKGSNLLIDHGVVKLGDFGCSKAVGGLPHAVPVYVCALSLWRFPAPTWLCGYV